MGFLHQLWDETLAGPAPNSGLGKLRKYNSFSAARSPAAPAPHDEIPVSRSITILRTNSGGFRRATVASGQDSGSAPSSPAGSSTPSSPFSSTASTPRGHFKRLRKRESTLEIPDPRNPTVYDWIVIDALDR